MNNLSGKLVLVQSDITKLKLDAICNAANEKLLGGGGVDGVIHRKAGIKLYQECKTLGGCEPGDAKITGGYRLPSRHIIHTVGPRGEDSEVLRSCYVKSLELLVENNLRTIAFPCISTGIFGYPNERAAQVALKAVVDFLKDNSDKVDQVTFCTFLDKDYEIYDKLLEDYQLEVEGTSSDDKEESL